MHGGCDVFERWEEEVRMKELQSQKARIVAQMVPTQPLRASSPFEDTENVPVSASEPAHGERRVRVRTREALPAAGSSSSSSTTLTSGPPKVNGFDAAAETLCSAFDALAQHQLFRHPSDDIDLPEERVLIASWVDYCNEYGMGYYALTDESVGMHFNDSTTLAFLQENSPKASATVFERFRAVLKEGNVSHRVQYMIKVLMHLCKDKYKDNPILPEGLVLVEEEEQFTHEIQLEEDRFFEEGLSTYPISCTSRRGCSLLTDFFKAEIFHNVVMHFSLKPTGPPKSTTPRRLCVEPKVSKSAAYRRKTDAHPDCVHKGERKPYLVNNKARARSRSNNLLCDD